MKMLTKTDLRGDQLLYPSSGSRGVLAGKPQDTRPDSSVQPSPEKYRVDWPSLLECQGDDYEVYGQIFDSFDELKEYVVEGLDVVIN